MITVSNSEGYSKLFSCYEEVREYFGEEEFDALMNDYHSEYSLKHIILDESEEI